ncbi:hypothetical protein [Actinotalea fermentans]|uniref:Uncharacterized protein n=1 Tax=Actinotalea fermentans TaxID=43671 RepID=A0A511YYH0_9CELL|nr:hypothetical protein [Actinotalea fermentans]GEN80257.1 hypothetical protein AFE02nite_19910 [Actinotalea fermentans]
MRASVRAALLVGGGAALALGVSPALAAPLASPAPAGGWSVTEGPRDGEGKVKVCPEAGSDGVPDMSRSAMASMHRAHHRDRAGDAEGMAGMHRAHHRDGGPRGMMGGHHGDMMDGVDDDDMMDSRDDDMMRGRDGDDMMGGRDADDMMGPGHMGR